MAAVLKLCVVLICLGLVESILWDPDCDCYKCAIRKRIPMNTPTCTSTTYRQRYTTCCGFWGWRRCTKYRTGYRRTCTGHANVYKLIMTCRPGCKCHG